jgi:tetratricopeptide (TPR) repeat protein/tRNA A-37 threonylcarbamoyl transferase component Bud32
MVCSRCGSEIPISANSCPRCNASRVRTTATGLQTPPPPVTQTSDTARLADGDAPTIFSLPPPASSADLPPPASSADGGQTIGPGLGNDADIDPELTIQPGSAGTASSDQGPLDIGSAFGTRYHIIRLLGIGGMGAVYQAWDAELGVSVAIKVIRPEVMADPTASAEVERRFKRELLLARQVTHKNVVRIHDIGEMLGIKYITMPYVDGADLATVSRNEGRLPIPKLLRIARGIVSGLVAAHTASVVHRDLKPANIMIGADDEAMIMDFGIALSSGAPSAAATVVEGLPKHFTRSAAKLSTTMAGAVVGTVEYMAPEQARGQTVDQRADIYAFGLILYDLLVGRRRAEHAQSAIAELQGRMEQPPPPPRSVVPEIPEALDHLVARCLEPDREKRYQTSAELAADLERLDENGVPIPIKRVVGMRAIAALVSVAAALLVGTWYYARGRVPVQHPTVSVLIADFDNRAKDPVFEGTLENALGIAIEGASFITAYKREDAQKAVQQLKPGSKLDEPAAILLSVRDGVKVVLSGSIEASGSGYRIAVKEIDPAVNKVLATATASASDRAGVLKAVASVASRLRRDLGDATPESEKIAAAETVTTASLEALQLFTRGKALQENSKYEESLDYLGRAIALDPKFGRAYSASAISAFQLGRKDDAKEFYKKAFALMERMTEREQLRTYGGYAVTIAANDDEAIKNYTKLVDKYPSDRIALNNLAVAWFYKLDFPKALDYGRRALEIYPRDLKFRNNYALFAMYASDFATAETDAGRVLAGDRNYYRAYLPLAVAALANGNSVAARDAYASMGKINARGASVASMGLADLALYEGRFSDAQTILKSGITEDEQIKNPAGMAVKQLALAEAYTAEGRTKPALDAVASALQLGREDAVLVPAARMLLAAGKESDARSIAEELGGRLQPKSRAYAKIIEGEIARRRHRLVESVEASQAAQKLADLWLARFTLGVGYVEAEHYAEGLAELDACQRRRGEATALFLDDIPTFRYLAPLPYWLGRAKEGLGLKSAADQHYQAFLAIRGKASRDPLVVDANRRVSAR